MDGYSSLASSVSRVEGNLKELLPLGRRVLIKPHETPDYKGTIILPPSVKSVVPTTGRVEAVGFDFPEDHPLREGDQVVFSRFGGVELKFDDQSRMIICHEDDILAIIKGNIVMSQEKV